jgi:hypothetical protein
VGLDGIGKNGIGKKGKTPGRLRFRGTGWTRPVNPGVRCMP